MLFTVGEDILMWHTLYGYGCCCWLMLYLRLPSKNRLHAYMNSRSRKGWSSSNLPFPYRTSPKVHVRNLITFLILQHDSIKEKMVKCDFSPPSDFSLYKNMQILSIELIYGTFVILIKLFPIKRYVSICTVLSLHWKWNYH